MPTLGTPSTWGGKRQFIPGSLAARFGCGWLLAFPPFVPAAAGPFDNGSWGGIGGAQALVCLFVAHAACLDAGGLRALLHLHPLPAAAARSGSWSDSGQRRLAVPFLSCLKGRRLGMCWGKYGTA